MVKNIKTVSIIVPTFNEIENVEDIAKEIINEIIENLPEYNYELLFIDNNSKDGTQDVIRRLCSENNHIRAIFNLKNYGPDNSPYYGLMQASGDCAIIVAADFQDPLDMIHKMVREWEKGNKVVIAIKNTSQENSFIRFLRTIYYRMIRSISNTEIIEHFTGFGCYDQSFIDVLRNIDDPVPFFRGVVAEFSDERAVIPYEQLKRRAGKSHIRFLPLYEMVMRSITSYTKVGLRIATLFGFITALFSLVVALVYFIYKIIYWNSFSAGIAPLVLGVFFFGAVQLAFLGLLGEYVMSINMRVMNRPIVVEKERINFKGDDNA
jgi:glycosyltransferase involved in cell wall biosynthesis